MGCQGGGRGYYLSVSSDLNESIMSCQTSNARTGINIHLPRPSTSDNLTHAHTHTYGNTTQAADTISEKSPKNSANVCISSVCNHRAFGTLMD